MNCTKCGYELDVNWKYCPICGVTLDVALRAAQHMERNRVRVAKAVEDGKL